MFLRFCLLSSQFPYHSNTDEIVFTTNRMIFNRFHSINICNEIHSMESWKKKTKNRIKRGKQQKLKVTNESMEEPSGNNISTMVAHSHTKRADAKFYLVYKLYGIPSVTDLQCALEPNAEHVLVLCLTNTCKHSLWWKRSIFIWFLLCTLFEWQPTESVSNAVSWLRIEIREKKLNVSSVVTENSVELLLLA